MSVARSRASPSMVIRIPESACSAARAETARETTSSASSSDCLVVVIFIA